MLRAYFDDSGTHDGAPVVVIGGLVGTEKQWGTFETAWEAALENPCPGKPKLEAFHLTHCRHTDREFSTYNQAERDWTTRLFRRVIMDNGLLSLAVVVNAEAWRRLVVGRLAQQMGTPEECCFFKCMTLLKDVIAYNKLPGKVHCWFDEGTARQFKKLADFCISSRKKIYPHLDDSMTFAPVKDVFGLQGADMIATESYHYANLWLQNKKKVPEKVNAHFGEFLREYGDRSTAQIIDEQNISEVINFVQLAPGVQLTPS